MALAGCGLDGCACFSPLGGAGPKEGSRWAHQAAHGNWSGSGGLGCTMLLFGLSVAVVLEPDPNTEDCHHSGRFCGEKEQQHCTLEGCKLPECGAAATSARTSRGNCALPPSCLLHSLEGSWC